MRKSTTPEGECLPQERQRIILERLASEGRVVAQELAQQFRTSEDTIRRDLRELAAAGLCHRVYGGALPLSPANGSLSERADDSTDGSLDQASGHLGGSFFSSTYSRSARLCGFTQF